MDLQLGEFGDARLVKGGRFFMSAWLRMAAKAQADLYEGLRNDGGTHKLIGRMQTRAELYATIRYHEFAALDSTIVASVTPEGMPQREPAGG